VTNPTLSPNELHELLGAYAIGAVVDPAERSQITRWLAEDDSARAELDGFVRATSLLHSTEGPSPAVWTAIESAISQPRNNVVPIEEGARRRVRRQLATRVAVAAVAIAAAIAVAVWGVPSDSRSLPTKPASDVQRAAEQAKKVEGAQRISLVSPTGGNDKVDLVVLPNGQGYVLSDRIARVANRTTRRLVAVTGGVTVLLAKLGTGVAVTAFQLPSGANQLAVVIGTANVPVVSAVLPTPTPTNGATPPGTPAPAPSTPTPVAPGITLPHITLPGISLPLLVLPPLGLL
jgi:hypothetical protein